jgi:type VI secretion system secreted protein VgrG
VQEGKMADYSQESKSISLKTPLGDDVLLLRGFTGSEGISRLFSFHLDLLSEKSRESVKFKDIIGKQVTITLNMPDDKQRYFNGFVSRFVESSSDDDFAHYQMEVVPWLWFHTRCADCKVFQNMTIPEIIEKVFTGENKNFGPFKKSLTGTYEKRKYCVQYRETDFNFVSRLMEKHGIFYFFEHEESKHTLVLGDSASAHSSLETGGALSYFVGGVDDDKVISTWQAEQQLHSGKYTITDYAFKAPSSSLKQTTPTMFQAGDNSKYEIYDYPGEYFDSDVGKELTKVRMQEEEASHFVARGSGYSKIFSSGYKFELKDHPRGDMNASYVITEVTHMASAGGYTKNSGDSHYSNHFSCIPVTVDDKPVTFRPARVTPKPFVHGTQVAVVVGKSGEEITVDKFGRVRVQFYWDRVGKNDQDSTCWCRVSQPWAGNGYGAMWIPRIGQEVIVSFEEGDPDRPLIIGRVYNAEQLVPYALPDHQTVSTFMGHSSKGGGSNPNELRFEDKHGEEQLFINAQKDMDVQVINDSREYIKANRNLTVDKDQKELVKGNKSGKVQGDQMEYVVGNKSGKVDGNQMEQVQGNHSLKVTQGIEVDGGTMIHLKATQIVLEADTMVSLVVGGNFVTIGPADVAITGTMVMINSGGSAGSGGSPTAPKDPTAPDQADDGSKFTKK